MFSVFVKLHSLFMRSYSVCGYVVPAGFIDSAQHANKILGQPRSLSDQYHRACREAGSSACMRRLTATSTRAFKAGSEQRTSPVLQSTTTGVSPTCMLQH